MNPYLKLSIYMVAMFFICTQIGVADYTADDVATWQRFDWFKLAIGIGAAMFTQILSFLDQSLSRWLVAKQNGKGTAQPEVGQSGSVQQTPTNKTP